MNSGMGECFKDRTVLVPVVVRKEYQSRALWTWFVRARDRVESAVDALDEATNQRLIVIADTLEPERDQLLDRGCKWQEVEEVCGTKHVVGPRTQPLPQLSFHDLFSEIFCGLHHEPVGFGGAELPTKFRPEPSKARAVGPAQPFEANRDERVNGGHRKIERTRAKGLRAIEDKANVTLATDFPQSIACVV
jgi:hypothetical protein